MLNQVIRISFVFLLSCIEVFEAARIFCYQPINYYSHQSLFNQFTEALASEGHQLVVLTPTLRKEPFPNITEIDIPHQLYAVLHESIRNTKDRSSVGFQDAVKYRKFIQAHENGFIEQSFSYPQIKALLTGEAEQFDLIISDATISLSTVLGATLKAPVLLFSALIANANQYLLVGAETNFQIYPDFMFPHLPANVSFWQKLSYFYELAKIKLAARDEDSSLQRILETHMGQTSLIEAKRNVKTLFMNMYRYWDNNRPAPIGSVLYMGGFHLKSPGDLPETLQTFMENSEHGVVLMNFGSHVSSSMLPERTLRIIIAVFGSLPYDFIWKWDGDAIPNKPQNIRLEKNLPQNDLLHHPKMKAFITHAGWLSAHEAIAAGVPLVSLPILVCQWLNANQMEKFQIGLTLNINYLNEQDFKTAIVTVVEDNRYRENVRRLARILSDARESPLQTAVRWTGRLAAAGAARMLRAPLADATTNSTYMLDVLLALTVTTLLASFVLVLAVKRCVLVTRRIIYLPNY